MIITKKCYVCTFLTVAEFLESPQTEISGNMTAVNSLWDAKGMTETTEVRENGRIELLHSHPVVCPSRRGTLGHQPLVDEGFCRLPVPFEPSDCRSYFQ